MDSLDFNTVLLMGRPGSGKGTQAKLLIDALKGMGFSSGDRFKAFRDGTGPLATRVRQAYDKGQFLPDWFADYLLESSILELDPTIPVVFEGFGRTLSQAEHFSEIMMWLERKLLVLNLEVSEEEALARMLARAKIEHRPDSDEKEKIQDRFNEYRTNTEPAIKYFREKGLLIDIDGEQSPAEVTASIMKTLHPA